MMVIRFDTHSMVQELQSYGFEARQSEGIVEALKKTAQNKQRGFGDKGRHCRAKERS
jgi:hypothetical protein